MFKPFLNSFRSLAALALGAALLIFTLVDFLHRDSAPLPQKYLIATRETDDLAHYYQTRLAPILTQLPPGAELGCCYDGMASRENMRAALQIELVRWSLLPAKVGIRKDYPLVVLDFDSYDAMQKALPSLDVEMVYDAQNGMAVARQRTFPLPTALPPATQPAETQP